MTIALRTATASLVTILAIATAWAQHPAPLADIMQALRAGGYVIVLRHGATHADQADTDPLNPDNVAKQRHLNERGREQARGVGEALKTARVPIGKSYSSRFQRAVETARLIGGKEPPAILDLTEGGLVVSPAENNRRAQALRALAATVPDPGTNTLIVTHKPNIMDAFGKDWFEVREGEASIFRPDGSGKYTLVGRVRIDEWESATR